MAKAHIFIVSSEYGGDFLSVLEECAYDIIDSCGAKNVHICLAMLPCTHLESSDALMAISTYASQKGADVQVHYADKDIRPTSFNSKDALWLYCCPDIASARKLKTGLEQSGATAEITTPSVTSEQWLGTQLQSPVLASVSTPQLTV